MMQFFEPTQQLVAALILGSCTLCAALVNAVAQLRVAREARRKSQVPPRETGRVRRWVVLSAGLALALGWSATVALDHAQAADGSDGGMIGVASLLGSRGPAATSRDDALTVALLHLRRPLTDPEVVDLLHQYDMRAYAIDLRLAGEPETWVSIPVELAPAASTPAARAEAIRHAWQEACAYESVMATVSGEAPRGDAAPASDTLGIQLVRTRAEAARSRAERLAGDEAVVHALRVLASARSASRVAQDPSVVRAEIARYDEERRTPAAESPTDSGCEVVRLRADGTLAMDGSGAGTNSTGPLAPRR